MITTGKQAVADSSKPAPVDDGHTLARAEDSGGELPPSYSLVASSSQQTVTRHPRATNYLYLSEQSNAIKGTYAINPSMSIPPSVLPQLEDGETEMDRKNLKLRSEHGSINADILLVSSQSDATVPDANARKRTALEATSEYGSISIRVRTTGDAMPFHLKVSSVTGPLTIEIPRSFHGLLRLKKQYSAIKLSDGLAAESTALSVVDGVNMWFIGDFSSFQGEWAGDEVEAITAHGRIKVRYVEEQEAASSRSGFFSRLLGL